MKRVIGVVVVILFTLIMVSEGQIGSSVPFPSSPASSSSVTPPETSAPFKGGGGINPDGVTPPPPPIDTPFDAGIIFLLIIGLAYGVTKMRKLDVAS